MELGTFFYIGVVLMIIALLAYLMGERGMAGLTAQLARTILIVGLILGVILVILNFVF